MSGTPKLTLTLTLTLLDSVCNIGENFSCRFRKAGDLPGLKGVHELFVGAGSALSYVPADLLDHGEGIEFFEIVSHEFQDVHPFLGERAGGADSLPLCQGAGHFLVPVLETDQVPLLVHFHSFPCVFKYRHFLAPIA